MCNITLISSLHKELGKCNPTELFRIIERIQPEVIFEELSIDTFTSIYINGVSPVTNEARTIKNYIARYPIKHFPVDTYPIKGSDLFSGANEIAIRSNEYVKLWEDQVAFIIKGGYNFINSYQYSELLDKIRTVEERVLVEINDDKLNHEYESERELHNKREHEMLRNIYNYSKEYPYNKAILVCGVEHRKSIMQKIPIFNEKESIILKWTVYHGQDFIT